jgi:hypothetical protein
MKDLGGVEKKMGLFGPSVLKLKEVGDCDNMKSLSAIRMSLSNLLNSLFIITGPTTGLSTILSLLRPHPTEPLTNLRPIFISLVIFA